MMHGFGWGGGMWFGSIFWLAFLGILVWGILSFLGNQKRNQSENPTFHRETPLEILKRRLAQGEISHEEYEKMKKELL